MIGCCCKMPDFKSDKILLTHELLCSGRLLLLPDKIFTVALEFDEFVCGQLGVVDHIFATSLLKVCWSRGGRIHGWGDRHVLTLIEWFDVWSAQAHGSRSLTLCTAPKESFGLKVLVLRRWLSLYVFGIKIEALRYVTGSLRPIRRITWDARLHPVLHYLLKLCVVLFGSHHRILLRKLHLLSSLGETAKSIDRLRYGKVSLSTIRLLLEPE